MLSTRYSCQVLIILEFSRQFSKNLEVPYFMKIRQVEANLFHAYRRAEKHEEASSRFSQFCEHAQERQK